VKHKVLICLILFTAIFNYCFSQQSGVPVKPSVNAPKASAAAGSCKVKGKLVDSTTNQPVGYATVVLFRSANDSIVGGALTDDKGQFSIDNLLPGEYRFKIEFIGYNPILKAGIVVNDKKPVYNAGNIKLSGTSSKLKEVTVTGSKKFMENHLDKLVYNVENDITSQGGVATDILKKVPMVSVDIDGNIDLLGDPNVRVFINGKPSSMFDNNLAAALASIPASQIKTIEVITSPGAQYDAQGTGGIINIVLKDNKIRGINGNGNLSVGSRYENGYVGMHIRNGGLDINASAGGNVQLNTKTLTDYTRTTDSMGLQQDGYNTVKRDGYWGHTGFIWNITKTDEFDAGISYNNFGNTNQGGVNQQQVDSFPYTDTGTIRNSNNYFRYKGEDWNANYQKKFGREGQEIDFHYLGSTYGSVATFGQTQVYTFDNREFGGAQGSNNYLDNENSLELAYARPFSKNSELNVGVKANFSDIYSSANYATLDTGTHSYLNEASQDNHFDFRRNVYAAYASFTTRIFEKYDLKLGVRDEYTITQFPGDNISIAPYNFVTPSATISRKLDKDQTIKFAYSRRIQRPGYSQYNPFVNAADPLNLSTGNPYLLPQTVHMFELSYYKFFEQGSNILVTTYFKYDQADWQSYSKYYLAYSTADTVYTNTMVSQTINAATEEIGGVNISGTWAATKDLQIRCNINCFDKYLIPDSGAAPTNNLNLRSSLNATYKFNKDLSAEFYVGYNSKRYEVQGVYPSFASYNFAVRQQLMKTKANIAFTTTDPFNKYTNQVTYISGENFNSVSTRRYPYQTFSLSFNFKFGKLEFQEKKTDENEHGNAPGDNNPGENKS